MELSGFGISQTENALLNTALYKVFGNLLASRDQIGLSKKKGALFSPLENRNLDSRYKSEDESAIRQTRFQGRTSKGGQFPFHGLNQVIWRHEFLTGDLLLDISEKKEV
jgi:hypothetical protein